MERWPVSPRAGRARERWIGAAWALALLALRAVERTRPVAASHGEAGAAGARSARGSKDAEAVKKQKRRQTSVGKPGNPLSVRETTSSRSFFFTKIFRGFWAYFILFATAYPGTHKRFKTLSY